MWSGRLRGDRRPGNGRAGGGREPQRRRWRLGAVSAAWGCPSPEAAGAAGARAAPQRTAPHGRLWDEPEASQVSGGRGRATPARERPEGGRESAGGGGRGSSPWGRMRGSRLPREAACGSAAVAGPAEAPTVGSPCGDRCSLPSAVPRGSRSWRRPPTTQSWCRRPREERALAGSLPGPYGGRRGRSR